MLERKYCYLIVHTCDLWLKELKKAIPITAEVHYFHFCLLTLVDHEHMAVHKKNLGLVSPP
jgi:hypothetical protein